MQIAQHAESPSAPTSTIAWRPWPTLLYFALYYLAAELGGLLRLPDSSLQLLQPEQAVLFAALLLTPRKHWWSVAAATAIAHIAAFASAGIPPWRLAWQLASSLSCSAAGVLALRAVLQHREPFRSQRDLIAYACIGVLLTPAAAASISPHVVLTLLGAADEPSHSILSAWAAIAAPHAASILTLAPALWIWGWRGADLWRNRGAEDWAEAAAIAALTVTLYGLLIMDDAVHAPAYAMAVPLLWVTSRFGAAGGAAMTFCVCLMMAAPEYLSHALTSAHARNHGVLDLYFYFVAFAGVALFSGVATDARETATAALRKSDERFRLALQGTKDVLFDWDLRAGTMWSSDEHMDEPAAPGRPWDVEQWIQSVHEADRHRLRAELTAGLAGRGSSLCFEYRLREGDRITHIFERASVLRDAEGNAIRVIGSAMDVSDRKRLEEAERAAMRGARLAAVGEVTASITHELNQPLTALLSNAEAGLVYLDSNDAVVREEMGSLLLDMRNDVLRASEVILRLRPLVRGAGPRIAMLDIGAVVRETVALVAHEAQRRMIDVHVECGGAPRVFGDRVQLQQVLLNLIVNSMDAMMSTPEERRRIGIAARERGADAIEISVEDHGAGVPPELLTHIFKSYYTTKSEGMGLGLSISRSIVEAHGGRIWAENRAEGGAIFRFDLPVVRSTPAATHLTMH